MVRQLLACREGDSDSWDFGEGAGFYLNATQPKWKQYRMLDYIVKELPTVLKQFKQLDLSKVTLETHVDNFACQSNRQYTNGQPLSEPNLVAAVERALGR